MQTLPTENFQPGERLRRWRWHWNGHGCSGDLSKADPLLKAMLAGVTDSGKALSELMYIHLKRTSSF